MCLHAEIALCWHNTSSANISCFFRECAFEPTVQLVPTAAAGINEPYRELRCQKRKLLCNVQIRRRTCTYPPGISTRDNQELLPRRKSRLPKSCKFPGVNARSTAADKENLKPSSMQESWLEGQCNHCPSVFQRRALAHLMSQVDLFFPWNICVTL